MTQTTQAEPSPVVSPAVSDMPMLEINGLLKQFGGLKAVKDFNLSIQHGQLVGLIGPNGAGKTTTMRVLTGFIQFRKNFLISDRALHQTINFKVL